MQLLLGFGLAFELPVLLAPRAIVTSGMLAKYRRHAIVAIFILAMVLTPPDVASQVLMAIPMLLLYELWHLDHPRLGTRPRPGSRRGD